MISTPEIRIAMLGMIPGNGHPYSWSAIINGYDRTQMDRCPFPVIPQYLNRQPVGTVKIDGARVTHIWTDQAADAAHIAKAAYIPHVVADPETVIGEVDAVIIATDDGTDHTRRAAPFIEAGLPVFIDKPLATTVSELRQFVAWQNQGALIHSSSGLRYAPTLDYAKDPDWLWITGNSAQTFERYAIHLLEPIFVLLGPGFQTASAVRERHGCTATLTHRSGVRVTINTSLEATGSFGVFHFYGRKRHLSLQLSDPYPAFRAQLIAVIDWFRTGIPPCPFDHTLEMMAVLIASLRSADQKGTSVAVEDIIGEVSSAQSAKVI